MDASTPPAPPATTPAGPPGAWAPRPARSSDDRLWMVAAVIAGLPLLLLLFLAVVAPAFNAPASDGPLVVAGMLPAVPFAIGLVGMVVIAGSLSRFVNPVLGVVVAAIWLPLGLFVVILGPALVLIVVNLAGS